MRAHELIRDARKHGKLRYWFNVVVRRKRYWTTCRECWRRANVHATGVDEKDSGWYCDKHLPEPLRDMVKGPVVKELGFF